MSRTRFKKDKTGLLLVAGVLFAFLLLTHGRLVYAQSTGDTAQLLSRINQLENQVQTLSRSVYRGAPPPANASAPEPVSSSSLAGYDSRIGSLEQKQRQMTGQLEELSHQLQQLQTRLEKMQADNDLRLQQVEKGAGGAPTYVIPDSYNRELPAPGPRSGSLGTVTDKGGDPAEVLYDEAFADIRAAKYDLAETRFKKFMGLYPNHSLAGNAQYWLAETFYVRGDYKQAARMFAQGYQDYPQGAKAADCLLKLGLSLAKIDKKEDACLSLRQLQKEFPGETTPAAKRAVQEMKALNCPG